MTIANHSEFLLKLDLQRFSDEVPPEPVEPAEPIEPAGEPTEPIETNEPSEPSESQEDYFEVKYNKENRRISREEAPTYIQKGLNYDKVQQRVSEYEQHLNRVAQFTGYQTHEDMLKALEEAEKQQKYQAEAQKLGMDEEAYRQYIAPVNDELSTVKQQLEDMKLESIKRQLDTEIAELEKHPDFAKYENGMYEIAQKYNMSLTDAFEFASLRGLKEQIPSLQQQAEQKVVDQIKARQGKHVETHDENALVSLNLSPEEISMAQKMGLSPEEYAKWK